MHLILHRYYSSFLGHQEWPTWFPNLAQRFSSGHWDWALNNEGTSCPNVPCRVAFARNRETKKPLLVYSGVKIDTIHMATRNIVMDTYDGKQQIIQTLSASITDENVAQVYETIETLRASLGKQMRFIIPEKDDEPAVQVGSHQPVARTHRYVNTEGLKRALDKCLNRSRLNSREVRASSNFPWIYRKRISHPQAGSRLTRVQGTNGDEFQYDPRLFRQLHALGYLFPSIVPCPGWQCRFSVLFIP